MVERIIDDILKEIDNAHKQHGDLPDDCFECITIITEELGEAAKAVLDLKYNVISNIDKIMLEDELRNELIQVAAMCIAMISKMQKNENAND